MVRVSIVIPAYNAARYLSQTVESVRAQAIADWELVIIDDGSTDNTANLGWEFGRRDSRIRLIRQPNMGVAAARNRGMVEARPATPYITFLDHDDVWEPQTLELLIEALESRPEAVAAYGLAHYIDAQGRAFRPGELEAEQQGRKGVRDGRIVPLGDDAPTTFTALNLNEGCRIATPGQVLIRRSELEGVGGFDPGCTPCDDWDMWLRLSRRGYFAFVQKRVLGYRLHGENASLGKQRMERAHRATRRKLLLSTEPGSDERRIALLGYRYYCGRKLTYMLGSLADGAVVEAARQCARAARSYTRMWQDLLATRASARVSAAPLRAYADHPTDAAPG